MNLNNREIEEIAKLMKDTKAENVTLEQSESSGIGCILEATVRLSHQGHLGYYTVEITGVEDW